MGNKSSKPLSIAALVCGVVGIIAFFITLPAMGGAASNADVNATVTHMIIWPLIGLILGILGIVFGAVGMKNAKLNGESKGLAVGGLVCGIVGTVFSGIATLCTATACAAISSAASSL